MLVYQRVIRMLPPIDWNPPNVEIISKSYMQERSLSKELTLYPKLCCYLVSWGVLCVNQGNWKSPFHSTTVTNNSNSNRNSNNSGKIKILLRIPIPENTMNLSTNSKIKTIL